MKYKLLRDSKRTGDIYVLFIAKNGLQFLHMYESLLKEVEWVEERAAYDERFL